METTSNNVAAIQPSWLQIQVQNLRGIWYRLFPGKSNGLIHAERELDILMKTVDDPVIRHFIPEIKKLVERFGHSGQSGGSAPLVARALSQAVEHLCLFQPICPIMGIDEEWNDITRENGGVPMYQNNRCSAVFKDGKDGKAYYLDAIIFDGDIGGRFTGRIPLVGGKEICSRQYIKEFPFKPKTFYIDVIDTRWADKEETKKDVNGDWWTHTIKDESQLKEVFEYYDEFCE